jgi:four helix bundle protein
MGWRSHHDIEAWRLSHALRGRITELVRRPETRRDYEWCSQTRRAAGSACRNIAEGFYREGHTEFARFVNIAIGSQGELLDCLEEALQNGYVAKPEYAGFCNAIRHAMGVTIGLRRSLRTRQDPD